MVRDIIKIDEEKCNGCGICIPNCHEGALQIIDGKARLISELMCDGLGACIGYCPEGAITIEQREAEPYDEIAVISGMAEKGVNTVIAHLKHLKDHHEYGYLEEAVTWLEVHADELPFALSEVVDAVNGNGRQGAARPAGQQPANGNGQQPAHGNGQQPVHGNGQRHAAAGSLFQPAASVHPQVGSCPGSAERMISPAPVVASTADTAPSQLTHWPVQLHLVNPNAPVYRGADLLLAADCVAFSMGSFHSHHLRGKALAIACPKLDHGLESYIEKLTIMIESAKVNTITVMMMEVPCCGGLIQIVRAAQAKASRKVPVKGIVVGIGGEVLSEEWL